MKKYCPEKEQDKIDCLDCRDPKFKCEVNAWLADPENQGFPHDQVLGKDSLIASLLKKSGKTMDDVLMDVSHTTGAFESNGHAIGWLEEQEDVKKLNYYDVNEIKHWFDPWLFLQVGYWIMAHDPEIKSEDIMIYFKEGDVILFVVPTQDYVVGLVPRNPPDTASLNNQEVG